MVYKGKSTKSGWCRHTSIYRNRHSSILINFCLFSRVEEHQDKEYTYSGRTVKPFPWSRATILQARTSSLKEHAGVTAQTHLLCSGYVSPMRPMLFWFSRKALHICSDLQEIKKRVEQTTGETFNSVLCNRYRTWLAWGILRVGPKMFGLELSQLAASCQSPCKEWKWYSWMVPCSRCCGVAWAALM